jgi:hypothetical protein
MHSYLRSEHGDLEDATDSVMYGPSTQNKIERWWRELLERMERYFKQQLNGLIEDGQYDRDDASHRLAVQLIATSIPISSSYSLHY